MFLIAIRAVKWDPRHTGHGKQEESGKLGQEFAKGKSVEPPVVGEDQQWFEQQCSTT